MTLFEFAAKYCGKKVDYDKYAGFQCTDLFRQYCHDFGIPHTGSVEGAKELWEQFSENDEKKYFNRFNATYAMPGDVLIEDATATNRYGHVSIVLAADSMEALVLQQNGLTQQGCELAVRDLRNALGILRRK